MGVGGHLTLGWTLLILATTIMTTHHSVEGNLSQAIDAETRPSCDFKEDDVRFFDVKMAPTAVPTDLTTYVCQRRTIPTNPYDDFHAIGFLPLVGNKDIVHHMILFGCSDPKPGDVHRCDNTDNECRQFLVQWSRGIDGAICNHPEAGNRFGLSSFKTMSLQIHWNNHNGTDGLQDSSGFRVFYTSKLRKNDVGNVQIGQNDLEIPAGQARFPQSGGCSSDCTQNWLSRPIYLTRAHIHLHYTGVGGLVEILRDGSVVSTVVNDQSYDYNQPPSHSFDHPFQVLPGDEVRVTCLFNTRDGARKRNRTLYWGEGSDGEMCYAFVTYYPLVKDFDQCIQFDTYDICSKTGFVALGECIFPGFVHVFEGMGDEIIKQCTMDKNNTITTDNITTHLCTDVCRTAIKEVTDHPCMQGRLKHEAERVYLPNLTIWPTVKSIIDQERKSCQ